MARNARSILDGYFNPLVFWYQWDYLRSPAKNLIFCRVSKIGNGNGRNGYITSNNMDLPSGKHSQFAIEAMATEIVDLPINSMVIFHSFLYVYQRVMDLNGI